MVKESNLINLNEFGFMSRKEQKERLNALFEPVINPSLKQLDQWFNQVNDEIQQYESKYEMLSNDMLESLRSSGRASGFPDICSWLMLLKTKNQIEEKYKSFRFKYFNVTPLQVQQLKRKA